MLTTHAASLPQPDELARLMFESADGKDVDRDVLQRLGGFSREAGEARLAALELAEFPDLAGQISGREGAKHLYLPVLDQPLSARDPGAIQREIDDLLARAQRQEPRRDVHLTFTSPPTKRSPPG